MQLPRSDASKQDRVPNPLVEVEIIGADADVKKHKTNFVLENAWNPVFQKTFDFDITEPDLALVRFVVYDYENGKVRACFSYWHRNASKKLSPRTTFWRRSPCPSAAWVSATATSRCWMPASTSCRLRGFTSTSR